MEFYKFLGFQFPEFKPEEDHLEPATSDGSARLMIDSKSMVKEIIGAEPMPGNHSSFAIKYDKPAEVDWTVEQIKKGGFTVVTEPWDAFWGSAMPLFKTPMDIRSTCSRPHRSKLKP